MQLFSYLRFSLGLGILLFLLQCSSERPSSIPDVFRSSFFSDRFKVVEQKMYALEFPQALQQVEQLIYKSELLVPEQKYAYLQAAFLNLSLEKTKRGLAWIQRFRNAFPDSTKWSVAVRAHYHLVKGMAEYQELELFEAKEEFLKAVPLLQKVYTNNHYYVAVGLTQMGLVLFDIDHTQVLVNEYIEQAEAIYQYNPSLEKFAWEVYLGKALQSINDHAYQKTQSAIAQALYLYQNLPFKLPIFHGRCLLAMGNALKKLADPINRGASNYDKADSCFHLAVQLITPSKSIRLQECYRDICILCVRASYNQPFKQNLQALKTLIKTQGRDIFGFPDRLIGFNNYIQNNADSTHESNSTKTGTFSVIHSYEQFLRKNTNNPYHRRHLDEAYFFLMRTYARLKNYPKAIYYCQKNIQLYQVERQSATYQPIVGVPMDTNEVAAWIGCGWQAGFQLQLAKISKGIAQEQALKRALNLFILFDAHFFNSILNNQEDALIGFQNEVADIIYQNALEACYEHYLATKDEKSINLALRFSERSKSHLLYRDMLKQNPDQVAKRNALRSLQNEWNKLYFVLSQQSERNNKELFRQLNQVEKKLTDALADMRVDTLAYHKKIEQPSHTLAQIKRQIHSNQQVIHYVLGEQQVYAIAISKEKTCFVKTNTDSLAHFVQRFLGVMGISGFPSAIQNQQYLLLANTLFNHLIKPLKAVITDSKTTIIVPDQYLHLLPFEALLETPITSSENLNFKTLPYFLWNGPIVYTPSWKVYAEKSRRDFSKISSGQASFWAASDVLQTQELKSTLRRMYGQDLQVFEAKNCKRDLFLQQLPQLQGLVQLSVHAESSLQNRLDNKFKFPSDNPSSGYLYGFDCSALSLDKIDLMVLAACQSNFGQTGGEGTFSLARSFTQAGVGAIVGTLWSVDNGTTNRLLDRMYHHLAKKRPLEKAIWLAKKEFVTANQFNFPSSWAGIVLTN
ncbi:CHAT domain-containing protein [Haliscomenobacter sp.]|uniref:CHAT domain-containing protein n=1 Tax=Haliscomenobacter sp. TaxID=2717303 RepID=UPI0035932CC8